MCLTLWLLLGSCSDRTYSKQQYCPNFNSLIRSDSTIPVMAPDFHMSHDSLGRSIQNQIGGDTCGIAHIGIQLATGDTLPIHIPYPICYTGPAGCVFRRARFSICLNRKAQVLINGDVYSLRGLAQQVPNDKVSGPEYNGGFTDIYYDSKVPSDSVYLLLENVLTLYHRAYEHLSKELFQMSFCDLSKEQLQVLRELHAMNVYLTDRRFLLSLPPPPPILDSL